MCVCVRSRSLPADGRPACTLTQTQQAGLREGDDLLSASGVDQFNHPQSFVCYPAHNEITPLTMFLKATTGAIIIRVRRPLMTAV